MFDDESSVQLLDDRPIEVGVWGSNDRAERVYGKGAYMRDGCASGSA